MYYRVPGDDIVLEGFHFFIFLISYLYSSFIVYYRSPVTLMRTQVQELCTVIFLKKENDFGDPTPISFLLQILKS